MIAFWKTYLKAKHSQPHVAPGDITKANGVTGFCMCLSSEQVSLDKQKYGRKKWTQIHKQINLVAISNAGGIPLFSLQMSFVESNHCSELRN